jgi:DNA repair protein RecO
MALEQSEAIILKAFNWSESSRTVHFFTEKFGKLPLMDRGGRSYKSKRGRLIPFSRIDLGFYHSERGGPGYLSAVDVIEVYSFEKEGTLGRLAYGSAACELISLLLPEGEPHPELYQYTVTYLSLLDQIDKRFIPACFLTYFLRLVSHLGFHPSLSYCVVSGKETASFVTESSGAFFSPERGGVVSPACQKPGEYYIDLPAADLKTMATLQTASLKEAARIGLGFDHAARMINLLVRFLSYQADTKQELKSLEFLEKLKNSQLNG